MNLDELRKYKPEILRLAQASGVSNIRVFGSVARGESTIKSDADLLVHVDPKSGWDFFGFHADLQDLLKCKVDVVSDRAINKHIKQYVLDDSILL